MKCKADLGIYTHAHLGIFTDGFEQEFHNKTEIGHESIGESDVEESLSG
jgi:hypothetical protein